MTYFCLQLAPAAARAARDPKTCRAVRTTDACQVQQAGGGLLLPKAGPRPEGQLHPAPPGAGRLAGGGEEGREGIDAVCRAASGA